MDLHTSSPYIVKISACGDVQDLNIIREDTNGFFPTFEFLDNGNILLIGQCKLQDTLAKFDHLWLCEIDTNLNIVKEKTYFMLKDEYYEYWNWYSLRDQIGNIILAGNYIYYPGHHDLVYLKVNQNCDTVLSKSYHYQFGQVAGQIFNQPDTSYLSVVERINPSQPLSLVELDTNLTIINITPTTLEYNFFQGYTITWIDSNVNLHSASRYDYSSETRSIGVVLADSGEWRPLMIGDS
jgi:hypothetical protein